MAEEPWTEAFKRGDPEAFRAVVETHGNRMLRFAATVLGDRSSAEDVVQDVFTRLYHKRDTIRDLGTLRSWLMRATLNASYDVIKKRKRSMPLFDTAEETFPANLPPEAPEIVRDIVSYLPPRLRSAFALVYAQDLSPAEAAETLGVSANTLRQRLFAARQKIRQHPKLLRFLGERHAVPPRAPADR